MPPDPRPRKRVRNKKLLAESQTWPSQVVDELGLLHGRIVTHHLCCRHDEKDNLARLPDALHKRFHDGPNKMDAARKIRESLTPEQVRYIIKERGEGWLAKRYPGPSD